MIDKEQTLGGTERPIIYRPVEWDTLVVEEVLAPIAQGPAL
jgi:hypothetical protein